MKPSPQFVLLCAWSLAATCPAQRAIPTLEPTPRFPFPQNALTLRQPALPSHPFTVTGKSGAILGMQDGTVELWQLPTKLFSGLHLHAEIEGYPVPIDLNPLAAELEVYPSHTTLTYAHAALTVRQHMFVPAGEGNEGLGGILVFEIEAIRPVTLVVSLTPSLAAEWPAPQWGQPGWDWRPLGTGGAYTLSTDNPHVFGMIGMPNATPGTISPYQEHPRTYPLEFRVHFDPKTDSNRLFPLLCAAGRTGEVSNDAGFTHLQTSLLATATALPSVFARTETYYAHFFDERTVVHTPDPQFDRALQWAELAIDKAQVTIPAMGSHPAETGLVAGWFPAFDSARPGFGWFFGRDTLWSLPAIDSYGDAALARTALEFLMRRQRADGKMMHEYSQTAASLTGEMAWDKLPYEYAAADATPLFLLAMQDYVRSTGDLGFLRAHWDAIERAFRFERTHDSDGDGVYDNAEGTGWVEGWPPKLPRQELYLAALDRDATRAMAQLANWAGHGALATEASQTATKLSASVAAYRQPSDLFAFSKNADGTYDPTLTVYPSVAFWNIAGGLPGGENMLEAWAGAHFSTDWGTRAVAETDPVYDPISYHQGTVWPLFTGWTAMAEYRSGHPLAGYAALHRNVDLTWAQDPGSVTEVLSGNFYEPLGRSSTHQLWSSAMVLAPTLRELFGLEPDAPTHTLLVHPHLPPGWDKITVEHLHVGQSAFTVTEERQGAHLLVTVSGETPTVLCLRAQADLSQTPAPCQEPLKLAHSIEVPLAPIELTLSQTPTLLPGAYTEQPHIIRETYTAHATSITVEAMAGSKVDFSVRHNGTAAHAASSSDGVLSKGELRLTMPAGSGFVQKIVRVTW